jgi:hypothetical protein
VKNTDKALVRAILCGFELSAKQDLATPKLFHDNNRPTLRTHKYNLGTNFLDECDGCHIIGTSPSVMIRSVGLQELEQLQVNFECHSNLEL